MGLPALRPERPRFPLVPLLVVLIPLGMTFVGFKYLQVHTLRPLHEELKAMKKAGEKDKEDNEQQAKELARLERQVGALQAISRVEIVWGGSANTDVGKVTFPYQHAASSGVWIRPDASGTTVWYYTDEGDTLARIAAHPQVLGAKDLWPILAQENNLNLQGGDKLPAGKLIRVPSRLTEGQIRHAPTAAGASDKARNEIFALAGIKP